MCQNARRKEERPFRLIEQIVEVFRKILKIFHKMEDILSVGKKEILSMFSDLYQSVRR